MGEGGDIETKQASQKTKLIRPSHDVIVRAPGLLPMLYTTTELAAELHIEPWQLREWISAGMPHQYDPQQHIFIDGHQFAAWVISRRNAQRGPTLAGDEGFCLTCRKAVKMVDPQAMVQGKRKLLKAVCPDCQSPVFRGVKA